ncbi:MAG: fumarate hydratase, partial [Thermoplasmatales archaeon]|nr:fumarate hydratase [Thermoplasmatales archaeon]
MREISAEKITETVAVLCMDANYYLPDDVTEALKKAREKEVSPVGKAVLDEIFENLRIASEEKLPICQDCGTSVFLIELGQDAHITGGNFYDAINNGV